MFDIINDGWDLMVAHPPCTFMANSGARWLWNKDGSANEGRWANLREGAEFFKALWEAPIPRIAVENPIMLRYAKDIIGAEQARAMGLVNAVFPAGDLLAKAQETAAKIASRGPLAVAAAKRAILRGEDADLRTACELEAEAFARLFGSEDQRAGMRAFLEKAKATFSGR